MKIPGRAQRAHAPRGGFDFDRYSWDVEPSAGWHEGVVLLVSDAPSKAGNDMFTLTFGLEPASATGIGGRIDHRVPAAYAQKLDEFLRVFAPALLDTDEEVELVPADYRGARCAVRVEVDHKFVRRDGRTSYQVTKLLTLAEADEALGGDWRDQESGEGVGGAEDDLF
jgi:hypothetical protein